MVDLRRIDPSKAKHENSRSRIRHVQVNNPLERERLWEIEKAEEVVKFVEGVFEDEEDLEEFLRLDENYLVLAVEGKEGHVEEEEVGKLQGWVVVSRDDKRRLKRISSLGLSDLLAHNFRVLEVGFAKHPKAKSGQMAGAVRQFMHLLYEEHLKVGGYDLYVTAYIDPSNESSKRVLEATGFTMVGKVKYKAENEVEDWFYILDWQKLLAKMGE